MKHLPIYNIEFKNYLSDFKLFIEAKGYNRGKDCPFPTYIREFLFFLECKQITNIKSITANEIIIYHGYLRERPNQTRVGGLSDSMIKNHLFSLRLFFDFLMDIEIIDSSPARLPKFSLKKYVERNILTIEEIKELYNVCNSKQDRAILSLAYGCGLRRMELENLNLSDINLIKGFINIRDSKNHKNRTIPLADNIITDLKEYIILERSRYLSINNTNNAAFFINRIGLRKRGVDMNTQLKHLINKTNNPNIISKNISLHCLRHSIATHLLDNGASIEFLQYFLGHTNIDTSHIYSKRRKLKLKLMNQIK